MTQSAPHPPARGAVRGSLLAALLALVLAIGLVGPVVNAGSASAAEPRRAPVKVQSFSGAVGGKGAFSGRVVWVSRTRARLLGGLNDICPADGYAAVLVPTISATGRGLYRRKVDNRGCEAGGSVPVKFGWTAPRGKVIRFVKVTVCLERLRSPRQTYGCRDRFKFNPFVVR